MKVLKSIAIAAVGVLSAWNVQAQELPKPSPNASFTQTVGVTEISMNYSRPAVKERTIWGELVPYGKLWRAGANASSKISFNTNVLIGGRDIAAGTYAIFIKPIENGAWEIIISNYIDGWGTTGYTEDSDVMRISTTPKEHSFTENLLFGMDQITDDKGTLFMRWEKVSLEFDIEVKTMELGSAIADKIVAQADNAFRNYNDAAKWFLGTGNDKAKGLEMAKKSCELNKKFWNLTVLAEAYYANNDTKMAIKTAKEALELSKAANYTPYIEINQDHIEVWGAK